MNTIAQYIENNVVKWHDDKLNNNNFVETRCMNNVETRQWHVSTTMETTKTDKPKNEKMQQIAQQHSKLSITINQMKRAVTRFARQNQIDFAWQTHFHDHIIQNNDELNTIAQYIENNVVKWHDDKLNNNNFVETRQWHVSTTMETTKTDKPKNEKMQQIAQQHSKLSITINQMKRAVTRFARQNQIDFAWQTRFHDHIIQNNDELNTIAQYIENNVVKWHDDKLNNNNFVGTRCMNNVETRQWHVSTK